MIKKSQTALFSLQLHFQSSIFLSLILTREKRTDVCHRHTSIILKGKGTPRSKRGVSDLRPNREKMSIEKSTLECFAKATVTTSTRLSVRLLRFLFPLNDSEKQAVTFPCFLEFSLPKGRFDWEWQRISGERGSPLGKDIVSAWLNSLSKSYPNIFAVDSFLNDPLCLLVSREFVGCEPLCDVSFRFRSFAREKYAFMFLLKK